MKKIKKADQDFTIKNLPHNRMEVFEDSLKLQFWSFIKIGLLLLIFFIPTLAVIVYKDQVLIFNTDSTGNISEKYYTASFLINLLYMVTLPIFGLGVGGVLRVIRNIVWQEPLFFKDDFIDGLKKNSKYICLIFFIFGLIISINSFTSLLKDIPAIIRYIPFSLSVVLLIPVGLIMLSMVNIYAANFKQCIASASQIYIKDFLYEVLSILLLILPFGLLLIPTLIIKYFLLILGIIIILPICLLGYFLINCYIFDKEINKENYPEIYDKGIVREVNDAEN